MANIKLVKIYSFFIFLCFSELAYAKEYTIDEALQKYTELELRLPTPEDDGRIQTLNKKGAMSPYFDEATTKFMGFAKNKKVLEVGGAYGNVMREVLKKYPNTIYHLNDLDERHLFIAAREIKLSKVKAQALKNIKFISDDICKLQTTNKYDAILIARVLHFFSPKQMESALANIFNILNPGGRVYTVAITPYVKRYKSFIPEYEKRLARNELYPGYVKSLRAWLNEEVTNHAQNTQIADEPFMFLGDKVIMRFFKDAGFKILECKMVDLGYPSSSWSLDGRENVILIAEKPMN